MGVKFTVLVNGAVFLNNKILIIQRSHKEKHQAGKWCLPGGKLEIRDENLQAVVKREIYEETGIICNPQVVIYNNIFKHEEDDQRTLAIVFFCGALSNVATALEDTADVRWISEQELDQFNFPPNVRNYIEAAFKYEKNINKKI